MAIHVQSVTYHRNGISGVGFHSVAFRDGPEELVAVVFDADETNRQCYTAVLNRRALIGDGSPGEVFGPSTVRKYRGDHYDSELLAAINRATVAYDKWYDTETAANA